MCAQVPILRNRPITGQTFGLTLTGPLLRLWHFDARSFAVSQACRLDDPTDSERLVDIVGFLTAPDIPFVQRWTPDPDRGFRIRPLDHETANQTWNWTDAKSPYKYLEIREALFGSRTVVISGKAKPQGSGRAPGETVNVIIKAWWSFDDLEEHELRILSPLTRDTSLPIDPKVIECLPKGLGVVEDPKVNFTDWKTHPLRQDGTDAFTFCVIATTGPEGRRMPSRPPQSTDGDDALSLRNYGQIQLGVVESLWFAASKGVHHRDINLGNIMWIWGKGRAIGYLVDFGNARYLDNPRRTVLVVPNGPYGKGHDLSIDDGRSGTQTFRSIHTSRVEAARKEYEKSYKETARKAALVGTDTEYKEEREKRIEDAATNLQVEIHRYIDDLESTIYAFIVQVSEFVGHRHS